MEPLDYYALPFAQRGRLTPEEFRHYANAERMRNGVVHPGEPPEAPPSNAELALLTVPAQQLYKLAMATDQHGTHTVNIYFETEEDAQAVAGMRTRMRADWCNNVEKHKAARVISAEVSRVAVRDEAAMSAFERKSAKDNEARDAHRKQVAEYDKAMKVYEAATEGMEESWMEERRIAALRDKILATYKDYLRMSGGIQSVAMEFLRKAYPNRQLEFRGSEVWYDLIEETMAEARDA
jgi:hypothetical protein